MNWNNYECDGQIELTEYLESQLQVNDTIKCHDADDMIRTMQELAKENITTDFMYEKDGVKGFWLVVERIWKK